MHSWIGPHLLLVGVCLLSFSFIFIRPNRVGARTYQEYLPVLILWSVPLLCSTPILSRDAWAYMDQGYIVHNRFDPYLMGMGTLPGPFETAVDAPWVGTTTVYTPLILRIQQLMVVIGGFSIVPSMFAMKIPVIIAVVLCWLLIPRLAEYFHVSRRWACWLALLNPLMLVHMVGGMHNDALMIALVLLAMWLATKRWGLWTGSLAAGVAMAIKQQAVWAGVVVALIVAGRKAQWPRRLFLTLIALAGTITVFVLLCLVCGWNFGMHGFGWVRGSGSPTSVLSFSVVSLSSLLLKRVGFELGLAFTIVAAAIFLELAWLVYFKHGREPMVVAAWGWLAFCLCSPSLHPWYLLLGLVPLALTRISADKGAIVAAWVAWLMSANFVSEVHGLDHPMSALVALGPAVVTYLLWRRRWPAAIE